MPKIFRFKINGQSKRVNLEKANVTLDYKDIKATQKGSWTHVTMKEGGKWREFNVRTGWFNDVINRPRNMYTTSAKELVKRAWEKETVAGKHFADRRHVEGLRKMATMRGDRKTAKLAREALKKGDKAVSDFWDDWCADHNDEEIKDYFDPSPEKSGTVEKEFVVED